MITPTFQGTVSKGKLIADVSYYDWLRTLEGQRVEITVRKWRKNRSSQQNRYYHGVIIGMLSDFTGYDREEMHEALKQKFLGSEPDENGLIKIRSTTSLTTDEFVHYTNQIAIWAAEKLSVYIPGPNKASL